MHYLHDVPLVISHYLLDMGNLLANLQNDFRYRVELYSQYKDASNPRMERYKTKFLKSYRTDLLKKLPIKAFREGGYWRKGSMEAVL